VIDPGHGGDDRGDRGRSGTLEKDITLAVSRRLKTLIETRLGIRVLMTRENDRTVGLDERAALANNNKADIFLSLHTNASFSAGLKGTEVYYLNLDRYADEARRAAASDRQLLPVFGGGERDIEIVQWDLAQSRHVEQSAVLASAIEADLRSKVQMAPHSIQRAPLRVLVGANMPAVLVELGYLSNGEQERQLASDAFQVTLSQALFEGVVHYRDAADRPIAAQPLPQVPAEVRTASQR
jgi:N-acetylmuramoyl-L-alanine amidase